MPNKALFVIVIALASFGAPHSRAEITYPWCAQYGAGFDGGGRNCGFSTYEQCRAAISGNGGYCERNSMYVPGAEVSSPPRKLRH